ncbi:MAG TPA: patatin [Gammaproteobacteria bacterium]|nr:patatin [Gammaproteobacteria bacterium]
MPQHGTFLALGLLLSLLPMAGLAAPAEKTAGERPRIGLALSGGGARGLAHVGVLKVLEENHIPVDVIAGTSAGSIIAGLYAMGLSAAEIEKTILGIDWNEGFSDSSERRYRALRRKQDDLDILTTLQAGLRIDGVRLPKGLLQGQRLELLLKRITNGAEQIHDFDQLPIPFRAIATDIENGDRVVIAGGDIARAMHASMAIPGVYAPVEIAGKLLVDGGLSSNLPIKTVRDMGAEFIIAIDISTPLLAADELTSVLSVAEQVSSLLTQNTVAQEVKHLDTDDILITPDLKDYSAADFDRAAEIIAIGEKAARNSLGKLTRYRIDAGRYRNYRNDISHHPPLTPIIDAVVISTNSHLSQTRLANYIKLRPGDRFDRAQLKEDISYLYGLGYFSHISYQLDKDTDDGRTNLLIDVRKKDWGPNYLRAGVTMSGDFSGSNKINLAIGLLATEVNTLGAEWETTLSFGERSGIVSEFFQPISTASDYFVATSISAQQRSVNRYRNGNTLLTARLRERQVAVDAGRQFGNRAELRVGITRLSSRADITTGPSLPTTTREDGAYRLRFTYDTLDNPNFPHRGSYGQLFLSSSKSELGADANVDLGSLSLYKAGRWGNNILLGNISYADTINNRSSLSNLFQLGGFLNLSGYAQNELGGAYTALATLAYYRTLNHYFIKSAEIPLYIGVSIETGNVWQTRRQIGFDSLIHAGSIFIGADTYIGPIYIAYGFNSEGRQSSYLFLGRVF